MAERPDLIPSMRLRILKRYEAPGDNVGYMQEVHHLQQWHHVQHQPHDPGTGLNGEWINVPLVWDH